MSITTYYYRKNIGVFNNNKNDNMPSQRQQQHFLNRLAEMPANKASYDNASLWLKMLLLLTNITQLSEGASTSVGSISEQSYSNKNLPLPSRLVAIINDDNTTAILPKRNSIYYYNVEKKNNASLLGG
ncbi:hypothetical protein ABK905_23915 [Acerihabitans sp. KWT182]|uniref:Uncharacterized protein n=1 Tax=Acerihabitans sp. KWT182 TaxID=3157919 RepID=A0AAU7Q915_9GAMM